MKKNLKFGFNKKRLFCGIFAVVLLLCSFSSFSVFAYGNANDIMSPTGNGNVGSYVYPDTGGNGKAFFYLRNGINRYIRIDTDFLSESSFPGAYAGSYIGIGTNDVKTEIHTPVTDSTYKTFSNNIVSTRITYEFPYEENFSNKVTSDIAPYYSYKNNTMYPLCTGFDIPFTLFSYQNYGYKSDGVTLDFFVQHKFYSADVYCLLYSVDYDEDGEEIVLSRWEKLQFDESILTPISEEDNLYSNDLLTLANKGSFNVSFARPVLIQKIVIDLRIKVMSATSLTNVYPNLPRDVQLDLGACRSLFVLPSYFSLTGYNTQYNYSLFKSIGLAEDLSSAVIVDTQIADLLTKYTSKTYMGLVDVFTDNQQAFNLVGNIFSTLYSTNVFSGVILAFLSMAVLGAFVGLGVKYISNRGKDGGR